MKNTDSNSDEQPVMHMTWNGEDVFCNDAEQLAKPATERNVLNAMASMHVPTADVNWCPQCLEVWRGK